MAAILITDLPVSRSLDRQAMKSIRGGSAPWVYGVARPYTRSASALGTVVNFYQINNNFYADQMVNQFQTVDVSNTGSNSNINVNLAENGNNSGRIGRSSDGGAFLP